MGLLVTSWSQMTYLFLCGSCSHASSLYSRNSRSLPTSAKKRSLLVTHIPTHVDVWLLLFSLVLRDLISVTHSGSIHRWTVKVTCDGMHMQLLTFHSNPYAVLLADLVFSKLRNSNTGVFGLFEVQSSKADYQSNLPSQKRNEELQWGGEFWCCLDILFWSLVSEEIFAHRCCGTESLL